MSESQISSAKVTSAPPQVSVWRRFVNHLMTGVAVLTVLIVLVPLVAIFGYLLYKGFGSINWAFLTQTPKPVGEAGGGMANAIVGSMFILAIGSLIGVPLGIGAGIYLSEYGRNRFGDAIRFISDVLNGVPSIVIGIVAYGVVVLRQKHFSALAGGFALAIMMIPTIARTTEQMLLLVPQAIREAALRTRDPALACHPFYYPKNRDVWRDNRRYACLCASRRRDRASLVHRLRQSILESAVGSADRGAATPDFHLRDFALRRMASPGMGRCSCPDRLNRGRCCRGQDCG